MATELRAPTHQRRIFLFLVAYRWASLIPILWLLRPGATPMPSQVPAGLIFGLAAALTLLITLFHRPLNRLLLERPYLLALDMLIAAALLAVSHGTHSPYFLYALSPLLAGAFFFKMRGALIAAGSFTPLYLAALTVAQRLAPVPSEPAILFTQLAGIWIIPVLFSYPSVLLQRLQQAHDALAAARDDLTRQNTELSVAHRQLKIIHDLTLSLQAAPDVQSVQERVLQVVTRELHFSRAVVGLVHPISQRLGGWRASPPQEEPPPGITPLPLEPESGLLVQWLLDHKPRWWRNEQALTSDTVLNEWLGTGPWLVFPMALREHPIGVLLVAVERDGTEAELPEDRLEMLDSVVSQAAVALGTTMLCIDRARRLAVEQERNRIARDIHDTVAQSLFGIVFTLDACIKMLPDQVEAVRQELVELRDLASQVRDEVRRSIFDIWPSELTLERFVTDLRKHALHCSRPRTFHVTFNTGGDFDRLSPAIRRSLYRVAQEALSNVVYHAGVDSARVCLRVEDDQVYLSVQDQGRGFDPTVVLAREHNRERFGLLGVRERIYDLGGECEILSRVGHGTSVLVRVPVNGSFGYG